jgi:hypothetical protein
MALGPKLALAAVAGGPFWVRRVDGRLERATAARPPRTVSRSVRFQADRRDVLLRASDHREPRLSRRSTPILSENARAQREKELQKFEIDVQRFIEDAQAALLGARQNAKTTFLAKLQPAIEAVARKRELHVVLNQDAGVLLWGDAAFDITADVVAQLAALVK